MASEKEIKRSYPPYVTTERELREREGAIRNRQARPEEQGAAGELRGGDTEPDVHAEPSGQMSEEARNQQENAQRKGAASSTP